MRKHKLTIWFIVVLIFCVICSLVIVGCLIFINELYPDNRFINTNNQLIAAINNKDKNKIDNLFSTSYRVTEANNDASEKIINLIGNQTCTSVTVRNCKDYSSVNETYNGEYLLFDYAGILNCSKNNYNLEIKLNKSKEIIYLSIES